MKKAVIFEDNNLIVYFYDAGTDDLVCSFSHMDFVASSGLFWGEKPLQEIGNSSLGIVCKANTWFPATSMQSASAAIKEISSRHARLLSYGFSMGGYGAIKYSKLMNATHVVCLSPQWSIDPADTYFFDKRLERYFSTELHKEMRVAMKDVGGSVLFIYDPYDPYDHIHVRQIKQCCRQHDEILIPRIGHETIEAIASRDVLQAVIVAYLNNDVPSIASTLRRRRRNNGRRLANVIRAANRRHPHWAKQLLQKHDENIRPDLRSLLKDI